MWYCHRTCATASILREQDLTLYKAMSIFQAEEESGTKADEASCMVKRDLKQLDIHTVRRLTPIRSSKDRSPERERVKQFEDKQWCDRCGLSHRRAVADPAWTVGGG